MDRERRLNERYLERRREVAVGKVQDMLKEHFAHQELDSARRAAVGLQEAYKAWEVRHDLIDEAPSLYLSIDEDFPGSLPRVLMPEAGRWFLKVPHVSRSGAICVRADGSTLNHEKCGEHAHEIIKDAIGLIKEGISGRNQTDFIEEIESYWGQTADGPGFISIFDPAPPSRLVAATYRPEPGQFVIGNDPDELRAWLGQYARGNHRNATLVEAFLLWLDDPLYPGSYPQSAADLVERIRMAGLGEAEDTALKAMRSPHGLPVLLAFGTTEIAAIGATIPKMLPPANGSRKGRISGSLLLKLHGADKCRRSVVHRASPRWIHWRGGAKDQFDALAARNIIIIGCGALGADLAMLLAKAGIVNFTLVDPDVLTWDNIGRHLVGAESVGLEKVNAVSSALLRQFPHLKITTLKKSIENLILDSRETFGSYDLVICATADWFGESTLNAWIRRKVPVIFCWLEPHALAGHALLVTHDGGCLSCGRDEAGRVNNAVIGWADDQMIKMPACGGAFSPYGAIDAGPTKEMAAQLAVDVLTGATAASTLRTFIGDTKRIAGLGGHVREPWLRFLAEEGVLSRVISQTWPGNDQCRLCH